MQHGSGKWALVYSNISSKRSGSPDSPPTTDSKLTEEPAGARPLAASDSVIRRARGSTDSGDDSSIKESDVDSEGNGSVAKSPQKRRRPRRKVEVTSEPVPRPPETKRSPGQLCLDPDTPTVDFSLLDPSYADIIVARIERGTMETIPHHVGGHQHSSLAIVSHPDDVLDLGHYDADSATLFSDSPSSDIFSISSSSSSSVHERNGFFQGASTRRRVTSATVLIKMRPRAASSTSSATTTPTDASSDADPPHTTVVDSPLVWTTVPLSTAPEQITSLLGSFDASNTFRIPLTEEVLRSASLFVPALAHQLGYPAPAESPSLRASAPVPRVSAPVPRIPTPIPPRSLTPTPSSKQKSESPTSQDSKKKTLSPIDLSLLSSPHKGTRSSTGSTPLRKSSSLTSGADDALNRSIDSADGSASPTKRSKKRKIQSLSRSAEILPSSGWSGGPSAPGAGGPRVTIKDLLDSGMINIAEHLLFRNTGDPGVVQEDGSIKWRGEVFYSPSTFAKTAAKTLGLTSQGSFHNGWQYVFARGSPLTVLRDKYMAANAVAVEPARDDIISPPAKRHRTGTHAPSVPVAVPPPVVAIPPSTEPHLPPLKLEMATMTHFEPSESAHPAGPRFALEEVGSHAAPYMFHQLLHPPVNPHVQLSPSIIPQRPNFSDLAGFGELGELEPVRSLDQIAQLESNMELVGSFFE